VLDLVRLDAAEARHRGLREPRRDADAQLSGDQLQQRPARRLVEHVEPARDKRRQVGFRGRGEAVDDLG
jgi:hypothetical protein